MVRQRVQEEENNEFKPAILRLKTEPTYQRQKVKEI